MSPTKRLTPKIQKLVGLDPILDEDYSFFHPGGNDHYIQFFLKNFPEEYWELDAWDRHNLFLQDLMLDFGIEFTLDEDGEFAEYYESDSKGAFTIRALMDLSDAHIGLLYLMGESRHCQKFIQKLKESNSLHPCYFNSNFLQEIADTFDVIEEIHYSFEQLPSSHHHPITLKGQVKGAVAGSLLPMLQDKHPDTFNLVEIHGQTKDGSMGTIALKEEGVLFAQALRLSSFLELTSQVFTDLQNKYASLLENNINEIHFSSKFQSIELAGLPIEQQISMPVDKIDNLLRQFTAGIKPLFLIGNYERTTRELWTVMSTELTSGKQIQLEIGRGQIRFLLSSSHSISLMEKIEQFIARNIGRLIS